jgi:hypothetical protein
VSDAMQELSDVSGAVKQISEFSDLELLLDLGFALRSVPQDELVPWLEGNGLVNVERKHRDRVKYIGQPINSTTKEFDVEINERKYRLSVHPNRDQGIVSNDVRVKFSKSYTVGENSDIGDLTKSAEKNALYLLPLVTRLPLKDISYESVREFFEKNNGFKYEIQGAELVQFSDLYCQERPSDCKQLVLRDEHGKRYKPKMARTEKVWMDVYVSIHNIKGKEVKVELEVAIPKKNI